MIFHTAAEKIYYNAFFKNWHNSIKKIYPAAKFSLRFVGPTTDTDVIAYCNSHHILLSLDPITFQEISDKFNVTGNHVNGYYAMSRWISIPIQDDNVFITDVDIVAVSAPSFDIDGSLMNKPWFTVSKLKSSGNTLKLMAICLRKDICDPIRYVALALLENSPLVWSLDLHVRDYLMEKIEYNDYVLLGVIGQTPIEQLKKLPFAHASSKTGGAESKLENFKFARARGIF
jgi:hypothetical protein